MQPSFAYLYDGALERGGFAKGLARIEGEVSRLGIQGPVLRDGFHDLQTKLAELVPQGVKNLIFVGGDRWFLAWMPWISKQTSLSIGYLSMEESALARAIGIPVGPAGVEVIAARVIRKLDLGLANEHPFLTEAVALKTSAKLELEGSYAVSARLPSPLSIQNFALQPKTGRVISVAQDGFLEAVIQTSVERSTWLGMWKKTDVEETRIVFQRAKVSDSGQSVQFVVDGQPLTAKEVQFDILPGALTIIVGPERTF